LETEQVREFQPRETATLETTASAAPAHSGGAGYAPATPVKIEWPSDLQQVESDPGKVQAAEAEPESHASAPRPRRTRPVPARVADEPLVQIETGNDAQPAGSGEKTPA
jgi:hypothetical protein